MESLKRFVRKILILFVCIILIYAGFFGFRMLDEGFIGIVKDVRINKVVRIFIREYNFIVEGLNPLWYAVYEVPTSRSIIKELNVTIPDLSELSHSRYEIKIPISVLYEIDIDNPASIEFLWSDTEDIDAKILKIIRLICNEKLYPYISPQYKRNSLLYNIRHVTQDIRNGLEQELSTHGLLLKSFSLVGALTMPSLRDYSHGKRHIAELHKIEEINENSLKDINNKIERNKILNKQYYDKLSEISTLIKGNPDLLKYIYIDKLSDKIMVVNSIQDIDIMDVFKKRQEKMSSTHGEIDNLR